MVLIVVLDFVLLFFAVMALGEFECLFGLSCMGWGFLLCSWLIGYRPPPQYSSFFTWGDDSLMLWSFHHPAAKGGRQKEGGKRREAKGIRQKSDQKRQKK